MKKKIRDLTDEEIENICSSYTFHSKKCYPYTICIHFCPFNLVRNGNEMCIKDFIKELKTNEVEITTGEPYYVEKDE